MNYKLNYCTLHAVRYTLSAVRYNTTYNIRITQYEINPPTLHSYGDRAKPGPNSQNPDYQITILVCMHILIYFLPPTRPDPRSAPVLSTVEGAKTPNSSFERTSVGGPLFFLQTPHFLLSLRPLWPKQILSSCLKKSAQSVVKATQN